MSLVAIDNPLHNEKGDFYLVGNKLHSGINQLDRGLVRAPSRYLEENDHTFWANPTFTWSGISFIHGSVLEDFKDKIKSPFDSWSKIIKPLSEQRKVAAF